MILLFVAFFVLIIALINFINITSSQWMDKIRQFGLKKVLGAGNANIFKTILTESFLLFVSSLLLSVILVNITFPLIRSYTAIDFQINLVYKPLFLLIIISGTFAFSFIFSMLPAWRISTSQAVDNMKKETDRSLKHSIYKQILVSFQFIIAIFLIAFTLLVQKQVRYGISSLSFSKENLIVIKMTDQLNQKKEVFENDLIQKPFVENISFTQYYPSGIVSHITSKMNIDGENKDVGFDFFYADPAFPEIMGLELVQGRLFSDDISSDNSKILVNEAFVRTNIWPDPVGKDFGMFGTGSEIIGIVKDFHYKPVNQPITPLMIINQTNNSPYCIVQIKSTDFNTLYNQVEDIKTTATGLSPSLPVEVTFMDAAVEKMYQSELQFRSIFSLFAISAIVLCCLGILAMSITTCQRRVKEIGIRKVNGAKVSEILRMLNFGFVKWVSVAFVIATPYHGWQWTSGYKTSLTKPASVGGFSRWRECWRRESLCLQLVGKAGKRLRETR